MPRRVHLCELTLVAEFGRVVRARRKKRQMSQTELAAAAHVSISTISRIENGRYQRDGVRLSIIEKLAVVLRSKPSTFFSAVKL